VYIALNLEISFGSSPSPPLFEYSSINYYVYSKGSIIDESKYLNSTSNDDTHSIPPPKKIKKSTFSKNRNNF
jgi:hypothetical protein